MTRRQKMGIAAMVAPTVLFLLDIASFSAVRFAAMLAVATDTSNDNPTIYFLSAISAVLGLAGIILIIAIPVGLIVGAVLLVTGNTPPASPPDQTPPPQT